LQGGDDGGLTIARQLVGNNDEVTDLRFVGPPAAPTHLAVATNSPAIRLFDTVGTPGAVACMPRAWSTVHADVSETGGLVGCSTRGKMVSMRMRRLCTAFESTCA